MSRDKLFAAALSLPDRDRAELMNELAHSFPPRALTRKEEDGLLLGLRQIDEGKTVSGDVVLKRLSAKLRKGRSRTAR